MSTKFQEISSISRSNFKFQKISRISRSCRHVEYRLISKLSKLEQNYWDGYHHCRRVSSCILRLMYVLKQDAHTKKLVRFLCLAVYNGITEMHRRNYRGYERDIHASRLSEVCLPPTFTRYKRPSFEQTLCRNARALPRTPLRELTALPQPPSSVKGPTSKGEGRKNGGERGSGTTSV